MNKRRPALAADQLGFTFEAPAVATGEASLAGLGARVSAAVGLALKDEARSRAVIAAEMGRLLGEDGITKWMLDAWSAESKDQNAIPMARFLALIAVTNRHDLLDALTREIGGCVIVGDEIHTARIGDIDRHIAALKDERRRLSASAPAIGERR